MKRLPDNQCRRCGHIHEEAVHMVDPESRWALCTVQCECGHHWTMIYTAPVNLGALRFWIQRGCTPTDGPLTTAGGGVWHRYRLEGVLPAAIAS